MLRDAADDGGIAMSALGHKQTVGEGVGHVRFTQESGHAPGRPEMSAKCQKRASATKSDCTKQNVGRRRLPRKRPVSAHTRRSNDIKIVRRIVCGECQIVLKVGCVGPCITSAMADPEGIDVIHKTYHVQS
jgi:hypothetical protein